MSASLDLKIEIRPRRSENGDERTRRERVLLLPRCQFALARLARAYYSVARVLEQIRVLRYEIIREAQDLKAVAITDGPELHLGSVAVLDNDPARPTRNLIHGSIEALKRRCR